MGKNEKAKVMITSAHLNQQRRAIQPFIFCLLLFAF
jgi:hypothetical protein